MATIVTVSKKGWIVIPKEIREKHGIKPGDKVHVIEYAGINIIPAMKEPAKEMRGMFKEGPSLTKGLLEDRRAEREREDRKITRRPRPRQKAS